MDASQLSSSHTGQKQDSPLAELTHDEHKGELHYYIKHFHKHHRLIEVLFAKEKQNYWKTEERRYLSYHEMN